MLGQENFVPDTEGQILLQMTLQPSFLAHYY